MVIGGGVIGYIDANRPQPLFSSADFEEAGNCDAEWAAAANYARKNRVTPQNIANHPQYISLLQNWAACRDGQPQEGGGPGLLQ